MKRAPTSLLSESSMKCPKCGYENQPDSIACGLCAEVLKGKNTARTGPPSATEGAGASQESQEPNWSSFGPPSGPPVCFESGKMNYAMPKACVCCLGNYQDELEISAVVVEQNLTEQVTHTTIWTFPFCLDCSAHVKGNRTSWGVGIGAGILAFCVICGIAGPSKMGGVEWGFALGALAVALTAGKLVTGSFMPKPGPRCASMMEAVSCTGPHNGVYRWKFKNPIYGQAFAEMNQF